MGPERTDEGIAYHRPGLHVTVELWAWKNEAGFTTSVRGVDRLTGAQHWASLGCLYVACGLGPLQHVPENAGGGQTISKRLTQHAGALRRVMPYLDGPRWLSFSVAVRAAYCLTTKRLRLTSHPDLPIERDPPRHLAAVIVAATRREKHQPPSSRPGAGSPPAARGASQRLRDSAGCPVVLRLVAPPSC